MHFKISSLFFWGHASAAELNHDYLLVTKKKMQFIFYFYCIPWQCGGDTFIFHQRAASELKFVPHGETPNNL